MRAPLMLAAPINFCTSLQFLRSWALPHFYFHLVTAYDILRHQGVSIASGTT